MKLSDYSAFLPGLTYAPTDVKNDGLLVLRSSNIQNGQLSFLDNVYVDTEIVPNRIRTKEKDVLMCVRNGSKALVGKTALITSEYADLAWGAFMTVLRPKRHNTFLFQYLNSSSFKTQVFPDLDTATVKQITMGTLNGVHIYVPSLPEQEKIAFFLQWIDARIEKQHNLIETLKKYKRGLLQRILRHDNDWEEVSLSNVLFERKTYSEKDGTYEHATLSKEGVYGKTDRYDRDYLVMDEEKKYKITHLGDLCYNPANLKFGVICLNTYGDAIFSPIYITFEIADEYNKEFIGLLLTRTDFINRALKYQQGTVYERMAVSPEDLLTMKIKVPPLETQNRIAHIFTALDARIRMSESVLESLQKGKKQLLSSLFV